MCNEYGKTTEESCNKVGILIGILSFKWEHNDAVQISESSKFFYD